MKKSILWLIIIVIILIIVFFAMSKKNTDNSDYLVISFNDQIIKVLDSNPTTGYSWEASYDDQYLSLSSKEYFPSSDEGIVGSGGTEVFTFNPIKIGKTEIIFDYKRSWEEEPIETKHFRYEIVE